MKLFVSLVTILLAVTLHAQTIPEKVQKGITLFNEGNIDLAAEVLSEVIKENPQHGPARFILGQIAMERNQWKEAEEHLKIAVVSNPRRPHLVWQLYGKLQLMLHKYPEARQSFEQSLQQSPDFLPAYVGRAQSSLFLNDTTSALPDLERAASAKSTEALLLLSELMIYLNRDGEARNQLIAIDWKGTPQEETALLLLSSITGTDSAEKELKAIVAENLGLAESYLALGVSELRKQNKKSALLLFQIAFQMNDQNPFGPLFLKMLSPEQAIVLPRIPHSEMIRKITSAQTALKEQKVDQARELAQEILNDRPMNIPAELILIDAAEKQQNHWDAFPRYKRILSRVPDVSMVEARFASLSEKMEAHDIAECHIRKAIGLQPESGYFYYVLAGILKSKGKLDDALSAAKRSIALGFEAAPVYVTLGDIYYEKMEISQSIQALGKAVEKDPQAAENIASFALSALTTEDYSALRSILETHAKANPSNIETLYSLGMMYFNENDLQRAEEYLESVEKLAPSHSQVYYNLGLVNFRLGHEAEGKKAMARFEEMKERERAEWLKQNGAHKIRLQAQQADPNERIRLYLQLVSDELADAADLIALANSYRIVKNRKEAYGWFEKALERSPYNRDALAGASETADKKDLAELHSSRLKLLTEPCNAGGSPAGTRAR